MPNSKWLFVAFRPRFYHLDEIVGGDQVRPYELYSNLCESGHVVHLWETENPTADDREFYDGRLRIRSLKNSDVFFGLPSMLREMRKVLRSEMEWANSNACKKVCFYQQVPVGVVLKWGFLPLLTQPGIALFDKAKRLGMTSWAAVHDLSPEHEETIAKRSGQGANFRQLWLKAKIGSWMQNKFLPKASFVTSVSEPISNALEQRCDLDSRRTAVFMSSCNPILIESIEPWQPPAASETWTIGYLGSPMDVSLDLITESVRVLDRSNVQLLLAGTGMREMARHRLKDWQNIDVIEGIRYSNYLDIASKVDIWVMPFNDPYLLDYTWQLKMPMALATGRPVVRSAGSVLESTGLAQHFFTCGSEPDNIADAIAKVMDNSSDAAQRARSAREHILEKCTWSHVVNELLVKLDECEALQ